ncbi:50S ribosomal protein L2 [candidate division WWE3 bacterium RIFOXYC1_FULL_39_7]|uniref:50S ribosomal protein L2 n=2 Tax=Katanobacteria TaxID=422282 RepID=A0A1F4X450_UNCKA|nr:MAG: 50S ribosomal protein L2 [candidate division WWE3 bacterium RIFOXYC1_FULL_39_7]OGC76472.1 MAG: 50S ribosomal protein L2 [candidate division WWE3 bacterium RIFOXYD1_FULL_39_9]
MIKTFKPTTSSTRFRKALVIETTTGEPEKKLTRSLIGHSGRNKGRVSVRHKERGSRKLYRIIDFKRDKREIPAKVATIEYDPNRGPNIALVFYADGEKRYILAPEGLQVGMTVISGPTAEPVLGNSLPLSAIPLGTQIHNIELNPNGGGILARGAGGYAQVLAKEGELVNLKLPSGEVKKISGRCYATIGVLGNADLRNVRLGKAGRNRHLGVRPTVRGVAMGNPKKDHPHAGSYKTTGIGMSSPKTPWGKIARGVRTRRRRNTDHTIVKSRHSKK